MRGLSSVVFVAIVVAVLAANQHQKELKEHYDHLAYIAEFNCHRPQPRVISVHELFPEKDTQHKAFFPDVTVLHRCDNAVGCCPSNHVCRPKHTHPLHLPFKVTFLEHMGKHKKGSWVIDYYNFDNHTECECVDASVCIPPTEHHEEVVNIGSSHKPDHHSESTHHEPDHHTESSHHETDQHSEHKKDSHHTPDHHSESSHHEPDHHTESSHHETDQHSEHKKDSHRVPDHHSESSHHEPDHHSESSHHETDQHSEHKKDSHHAPDQHTDSSHNSDHHGESNHKTEIHTESSHKTEQHSSSYKPDQPSGGSSTETGYIPLESSSAPPEESPAQPSFSPDNEQESSTLPLLVNYILSSTTTPTTVNIDEKDISSFFD